MYTKNEKMLFVINIILIILLIKIVLIRIHLNINIGIGGSLIKFIINKINTNFVLLFTKLVWVVKFILNFFNKLNNIQLIVLYVITISIHNFKFINILKIIHKILFVDKISKIFFILIK